MSLLFGWNPMPHFSIVIPNLNQSRFLPDALESLCHQNVDFELAVMDGGSSDGVDAVVEKYSHIINYFQSGPDGGQAQAIKDGLNRISGDIIAWLNADDYYFPGALNNVLDLFEKNPDVDVVYGDAIHVTSEGTFLSYFPAIEDFDPKKLPFSCFICQPACFVRRSAYDAVGGINSALKYAMDWDLWCRLTAHRSRFLRLHEVMAAVRYYPETKTLSGGKQRYLEIWKIGRKYGRQPLPVSWPAFYRFDLSFKKNRSVGENVALYLLEGARHIKKRIFKKNQKTLYGFYPWQTRVDGRCLIQFPCYGDQLQNSLVLDVLPSNAAFHVAIDAEPPGTVYSRAGKLTIDLPKVPGSCRRIGISCLDQRIWEIKDVAQHY